MVLCFSDKPPRTCCCCQCSLSCGVWSFTILSWIGFLFYLTEVGDLASAILPLVPGVTGLLAICMKDSIWAKRINFYVWLVFAGVFLVSMIAFLFMGTGYLYEYCLEQEELYETDDPETECTAFAKQTLWIVLLYMLCMGGIWLYLATFCAYYFYIDAKEEEHTASDSDYVKAGNAI